MAHQLETVPRYFLRIFSYLRTMPIMLARVNAISDALTRLRGGWWQRLTFEIQINLICLMILLNACSKLKCNFHIIFIIYSSFHIHHFLRVFEST